MAASDAGPGSAPDAGLTIDELAAATGTTVRTARYYGSLGLLPPPVRRGRVAYYGPEHVARLELVKALQDHGFTLAGIERHLAGLPAAMTASELGVQRALLTAWKPSRWAPLSERELDERAGRPLDDADRRWLTTAGVLRTRDGELQALPQLRLAVELRDVGMPLAGLTEANAAVRRHMSQLADELSEVLENRVLGRYRRPDLSPEDAEEFAQVVENLRTLTLDAIVNSFQLAASQLVSSSLDPERGEVGA
jgi:DNA-binding transcriptional MerR regulator